MISNAFWCDPFVMYHGFGSELKVAQFMLWFLSNSVGSWWDLVCSLSSKTVWFDLHGLHKGFVNWLGTVPSGDLSSLLICRRFQPQREVSPPSFRQALMRFLFLWVWENCLTIISIYIIRISYFGNGLKRILKWKWAA